MRMLLLMPGLCMNLGDKNIWGWSTLAYPFWALIVIRRLVSAARASHMQIRTGIIHYYRYMD